MNIDSLFAYDASPIYVFTYGGSVIASRAVGRKFKASDFVEIGDRIYRVTNVADVFDLEGVCVKKLVQLTVA